jgi:hypothetical protein
MFDPIRMSKRLRVTLRDALAAIKITILGKGSLYASVPLQDSLSFGHSQLSNHRKKVF